MTVDDLLGEGEGVTETLPHRFDLGRLGLVARLEVLLGFPFGDGDSGVARHSGLGKGARGGRGAGIEGGGAGVASGGEPGRLLKGWEVEGGSWES